MITVRLAERKKKQSFLSDGGNHFAIHTKETTYAYFTQPLSLNEVRSRAMCDYNFSVFLFCCEVHFVSFTKMVVSSSFGLPGFQKKNQLRFTGHRFSISRRVFIFYFSQDLRRAIVAINKQN